MANANESLLDEAEIERHLQGSKRRKIAGIALLAILSGGSLELFGPSLGQTTLYILLACTLMPLGRWYYCLRDAKKLTKFQPATKSNPEHARIDRLLEETLPSTGMKEKPQLMISPRLQPNLLNAGRSPTKSVIIATEGIFLLNLSDDEMRALLAHELAHVKNRDLALNSLLSALASLSTILITFGYPHLLNGVSLASEKSALINPSTFLSTPLVYFGALCLLKLLTLYVNRAGESTADGLAAKWTGKPSALSRALQKIEDYERQEARSSEPHTYQIKSSQWRHKLGKEHPATDARIKALEAMSSSAVTGQETR